MADFKGVMAYCEVSDGKLTSLSRQVLGCGKRLANELAREFSMVLLGTEAENAVQEAGMFGVDKVYVVQDPLVQQYQTDTYAAVMVNIVSMAKPEILLFGQTAVGRDLAPVLAFRCDTIVVLDCVDLRIDSETGRLLCTKPIYGGNALANFVSSSYPQIATVRDKAFPVGEFSDAQQPEVITIDAAIDDKSIIKTKLLQKIKEEETGVRIEEASIIVSGGRGIGSAEGFQQLQELALLLNGAVGASRPACDYGWAPPHRQVGITGKIVSPELYIAVALSGSIQHLSGCAQSKRIVAINKDPEANIFNYADFGIVGDWKRVLPAFKNKLKELLASSS